jgi:hypothetical protein
METVNEPIKRMSRDIAIAAKTLSDDEARFLVDAYYMMQDDRKRSHNQVRALGESAEPNSVLNWLAEQSETLEKQIKRALDQYTQGHVMGAWMRQVHGIGPVLSAGLLAHIDIEKAPTVGHIWSFAGLDPTKQWEKGQRRPWNAQLKTLCWKIGQSFMKFSNDEDCVYGHLYKERKAYEIARNDRGENEVVAKEKALKVGKTTDAYKHYSIGKLPPAQIDARARRYAVKQFLSDMHGAWYTIHYGKEPPLPYPIAILGHAHLRKSLT